jgi:hypothetical protein
MELKISSFVTSLDDINNICISPVQYGTVGAQKSKELLWVAFVGWMVGFWEKFGNLFLPYI